jgi:hypothetical protein
MIRTLAVYCTPILDCSKDHGKTPVETASDEMVMEAVWALCAFTLLVSQQHDSDLSLTALDDNWKRIQKKEGPIRDQKMSQSAKRKVNE